MGGCDVTANGQFQPGARERHDGSRRAAIAGLFFHGPNEARQAGGARSLWQAGTATEAEIGTCLPRERGAEARAAGESVEQGQWDFWETNAGTNLKVAVWSLVHWVHIAQSRNGESA